MIQRHNRGYQQTPDPRTNNAYVLLDGQLRISKNVGAIQEAVPLIKENTKRQVKLTEKGKEYKMALLKRRSKLVSRVIRKSSEIDDLMYSFQNDIAVKEELPQLNDMFKMLVEIHEELENIDYQYADELWFEDIDHRVFSFKHKVHNWVREVEKQDKSGRSSKSSSKSSSKPISSRSSKSLSTKEMAVAEKLKVTELMAEASFIQKRREAEVQAEALKVEQELVKVHTRVRVLDKENKIDQSKAVISSGTESGKKVWLKEELHNISPNNSKGHHGTQNCNTFQEPFHYKEATFKRNYPAWITRNARNYTLINEIWTPDPTIPPSQDITLLTC